MLIARQFYVIYNLLSAIHIELTDQLGLAIVLAEDNYEDLELRT